jgi:hypothetical protein
MHLIALHDSAGWLLTGPKFLYIKSSSSTRVFFLFLLINNIFITLYIIYILIKKGKKHGSLAFILPNFNADKKIGPHHKDIVSFLVGSLLGDGYAERMSSGGVRFTFRQSAIRKEYLFWLHNFLNTRGYCSNNLPIYYTQITGDKLLGYYRFGTYRFTSLLWLYKLFYTLFSPLPPQLVEVEQGRTIK